MAMIKIREGALALSGLFANPIVAHHYLCDVAVHR